MKMMIRSLLWLPALSIPYCLFLVPCLSQTVPVTASSLQDGNALACATGSGQTGCVIYWAPVLSSGRPTVYRKAGGGMATATPMTSAVSNGAFTLPSVPDSALTTPSGLCWRVTLNTPSGSSTLGTCVQPSAGNYWFVGGVANFDDWIPSIAPTPTMAYVQSVNGCTGVCVVSGSGFSLTTNGSSGAATYIGGILNIPQYSGGSGAVSSVFGRTGAVIAAANDYSFAQISGSLAHSQLPALLSADIPNNSANTSGNAGTASAFAATPSVQCSGGQFATGITATGNANCGTPAGSGNVSTYGTITAAQFPVWYSGTQLQSVNAATFLSDIGAQAALGFTPYDSANPAGYITSSALTPYFLSSGFTSAAIQSLLGSSVYDAHGAAATAQSNAEAASDPAGSAAVAQANAEAYANSVNTSGTAGGLSGTPALPNGTTASTQFSGDSSAQIATDAFVIANAGTGGGLPVVLSPSQAYHWGDSITFCSFVPSAPAGCYVNRLAGITGALFTNKGVSGDQSCDAGAHIFNTLAPTAAAQPPLNTILIGTNDGVNKGSGAYEAIFNSCYGADLTWLVVPQAFKVMANTGATTGTCSSDITYSQATGEECTASASTITLTSPATPSGVLYIWYRSIDSDTGTWTYKIGSASAVAVSTGSTPAIATNNGLTTAPFLIRVTGLSGGTHSVVFTQTAAGSMPIIGVGTPPSGITATGLPYIIAGPPVPEYPTITATPYYVTDTKTDISNFWSDGLTRIFLAPTDTYVQMTPAAADYVNQLHPNLAGQGEIALAFESAKTSTGLPVILTAGSPQGQGASQLNYQSGSYSLVAQDTFVMGQSSNTYTLPTTPINGKTYTICNYSTSGYLTVAGITNGTGVYFPYVPFSECQSYITYTSGSWEIFGSTGNEVTPTQFTSIVTAVAANSCDSVATTVTVQGVRSAAPLLKAVICALDGDPTGITGWAPTGSSLTMSCWVSANNTVSYKRCNPTASSITPGAVTWDVSAAR